MTSSKKPYAPAKTPATGKRAGTEKFSDLCRRRTSWSFTNLGTWVVRDIRNKPGVMSQHSAGLALDLQYSDRAMCLSAIEWLIANTDELGISLVNDYLFGKYGRTWICDRAAWKVHTTEGGNVTEPSNLASDKQLNMIRAVCKSIGRTVPAGIQGWTKREASAFIDTIKTNPPAPEQEPEEAF